jgi:hypothetical protein
LTNANDPCINEEQLRWTLLEITLFLMIIWLNRIMVLFILLSIASWILLTRDTCCKYAWRYPFNCSIYNPVLPTMPDLRITKAVVRGKIGVE